MIKITYAGKDITDNVSINKCWHDMYAAGQSDTLTLRVGDAANLWDKWGPTEGDEINIAYGSIHTGKMFVSSVYPRNGLYTITATAAPRTAFDKQFKSWAKVRLLQIGQEIAARHGLKFKAYGVTDRLYTYILQAGVSDLAFLHSRAQLEGCAFLIYDGTLILYDEAYMEMQTPAGVIALGLDGKYSFYNDSRELYGSCKVESGGYSGEYDAGNGSARVLVPADDISIGSNAEATRFARGLLRAANKGCLNGWIKGQIVPQYAAASIAKLECSRAPSWNGNVFLTHVRNDYAAGAAKLFFRKPLEGY